VSVAQVKNSEVKSLAFTVGQTPLIALRSTGRNLPAGVELFGKAEQLNPGGSVKDRAALSMIHEGIRSGHLHTGKTILDATSGNTGIAYALIGAALGYPVTVCLPKNASPERKRLLRIYGATFIETDPLQATDGAQIKAKELAEEFPEKYFYPDQYNNDANWRAHYTTTAPEIFEQTHGRITHFVAGLGTTGTFVGTTRRLKELKPSLRAISMQPLSPMHGLEGMKHLATAIVPGIYDSTLADEQIEVATEDAHETTRRLARDEGLFVGPSSGGNVCAALEVARKLPSGSVVVTILCDSGSRYLSDPFWKEDLP